MIGEPAVAHPYRLPRTVIPSRYDLTLEPDLGAGTFTGTVAIELGLRRAVSEIVLNAVELDVGDAHLLHAGARIDPAGVEHEPRAERVIVRLASPIPAGCYTLALSFRGILSDRLTGLYRARFHGPDGAERTILATQLQATNARRVFPCFDEPSFKAPFRVTLVVADGLPCVSNGEVVAELALPNGKRAVRFAETMPLAPYLVAVAAGPFEATEPLDAGGVSLRTLHVPGKAHLTAFAQSLGAFALRYFTERYGIPYPGDKLDQVAIPDFAAAGMENAGCITYREAVLLIDPQSAPRAELVRSADVIAHEIAHLWFGDLVTLEWWNALWLNEAFATFMGLGCVDAYEPAWERWTQFALDRTKALETDALESTRTLEYPVESPQQAIGMLDVLTYLKGASLLRMLERFVGTEPFFAAVTSYLQEYAHGNATGDDLWDAIERVAGRPVRAMMRSWVFQSGYPVVTAALDEQRTTLRLAQRRFRFADADHGDEPLFVVPVEVRAYGASGRAERVALLEGESAEIVFAEPVDAVVVNAGGYGYYRVRYEPEMLRALLARREELSAVERCALVDDAWAAVLRGSLDAAAFLDAVSAGEESDANVWTLLATSLDELDRILDGGAREAYRTIVRRMVAPPLNALGWEPRDEEPARKRELRAILVRLLAITGGDGDAVARARAVHERYLRDPAVVEPNLAAAAGAVVAAHGDEREYERFAERARGAPAPPEQVRYQRFLAAFPGRRQMERTLDACIGGTLRAQDAPYVLGACLRNPEHGFTAWRFVERHWAAIGRLSSPIALAPLLAGITTLSRPDEAARVTAFLGEHDVGPARSIVRRHLERLQVNAALRARESARFGRAPAAFG